MSKFKTYIEKRVKKTKALMQVKHYERIIEKGWKKNLEMDGDERIDNGIMLLNAEAKLNRYKREIALM